MQTPTNIPDTVPRPKEVSLKDLAKILVKHFDYHEGLYDIGIQFTIAAGQVGTPPNDVAPGLVITIAGVGISKVPQLGPASVDAAEVNPLKPKRNAAKIKQ